MRSKLYTLYTLSLAALTAGLLPAQETQSGGNPFAQAKFVPDISLILDASCIGRNHSDEAMERLVLPGFTAPEGNDAAHAHGSSNGQRGFNLNYGELVISSIVDPFFDLFLVCDLGEESFAIEEAYFTTRRIPWGLQLKGGKFLSHFGRLNSMHTHQWDFVDAPLIYAGLFGESLLNEKGVRLTWVAPLETYFMLGGEFSQGENSMSFGRDGFSAFDGQIDVKGSDGPNLVVAYAKSSVDIGHLTLLGGLSMAHGKNRINHGIEEGEALAQAGYGTTTITAVDLTLKYLFDSIRCLSLQAEYLHRNGAGDGWFIEPLAERLFVSAPYEQRQGGFYAQMVGRLNKRVRMGGRFDRIMQNDGSRPGETASMPNHLTRYTAMAEYNPTEFSRLRLQYTHDRSLYEATAPGYIQKPANEIILQINLAIGAHGAHAF